MQKPGRVALPPSSSVYTDQQVLEQLLRGSTVEQWTFDLLDADMNVIGDITHDINNSNSTIAVDTTRDTQMTATLTTVGNVVDDLSYLIRPHYKLVMPDGGWVDFTLGVLNQLPSGTTITRGYSLYSLACADSAQLLSDDEIQYAAGFSAGTSVVQAINSVVETYTGRTPIPTLIPDTGKRLPAAVTWNAGTARIAIINDLLASINYFPAWFDERGRMRSSPIPDYRTVTETASFETTLDAIGPSMTTQPDPSQWFNAFLLTVQNPATSVSNGSAADNGTSSGTGQGFSVYYENNDPTSPISIPRWGHKKLQSLSNSSIVDEATAYAACVTAAQVSSRVYAPISFTTPAWPLSQANDIYRLHIVAADEPDTNYLYIETAWSMAIGPGQVTTHNFERLR